MQSQLLPSIHFEAGLEIGYEQSIAKFDQAVRLGGGTHFLLARNGRGKTTLLRTLAHTLKPIAGKFKTEGFMQYLPESLHFDAYITPALIFRTLLPKDRYAEAMALAKSIELDAQKPYGQLSTGNRRKTNLITAEFSIRQDRGNILLLDEPFSGLDAFARQCFETIWKDSADNVLRLVSCHPDYDAMSMPSAVVIESHKIRHLSGSGQSWSALKTLLN